MFRMEIPTTFVESVSFVQKIFTDVEEEYDALLHLMTLSLDWVWRRRLLSGITSSRRLSILDLACGTGLVTLQLSRRITPESLAVGLDLSPAMLKVAKRKRLRSRPGNSMEFVRAAGEFLPFRDEVFNYVTVGLALRNFGDKSGIFRETLRVILPSGWFLSVDFVRIRSAVVGRLYTFHIFHVLPALGSLVSRYWHRTLVYLANSIQV